MMDLSSEHYHLRCAGGAKSSAIARPLEAESIQPSTRGPSGQLNSIRQSLNIALINPPNIMWHPQHVEHSERGHGGCPEPYR